MANFFMSRTLRFSPEDSEDLPVLPVVFTPQRPPPVAEAVPEGTAAPVGSRAREAKLCNNRAKMSLNSARNLRTDIRLTVTKEVERLYQLVKEAEAEIQRMRTSSESKAGTGDKEPRRSAQEVEEREEDGSQNRVLDKIEESVRLISENGKRIDELRLALRNQADTAEKAEKPAERMTYARAAAADNTREAALLPQTLHSVCVSSTDEEESAELLLQRIRETIDAKEGWVKVERVRKAKDRKIIMGCKTLEDRKKVKERLEGVRGRFVVEEIKNRDPLLILRDVLKVHDDHEILRALRNQNGDLFEGLGDGDRRMIIKFKKKSRNPHCHHVVISTSPGVWRRATEAKRLYIDLQRVAVADQTPLVQCTRCLGFGHTKKFCVDPTTRDLCAKCGLPHGRDEPDKCGRKDMEPQCINCTRDNVETKNHHAFDKTCPVLQKWEAMARATIAYY